MWCSVRTTPPRRWSATRRCRSVPRRTCWSCSTACSIPATWSIRRPCRIDATPDRVHDDARDITLPHEGGVVEEWLKTIGLSERAAAFGEHGITFDDVRDLSEEDLRELGLTIGERKRLRRAIADLGERREQSVPPPVAMPVLAKTRAERRPLTVMFVDLVNSSSLAE